MDQEDVAGNFFKMLAMSAGRIKQDFRNRSTETDLAFMKGSGKVSDQIGEFPEPWRGEHR